MPEREIQWRNIVRLPERNDKETTLFPLDGWDPCELEATEIVAITLCLVADADNNVGSCVLAVDVLSFDYPLIATVDELEFLYLRSQGHINRKVAILMGITRYDVRDLNHSLLMRNEISQIKYLPTVVELALKAEHAGLLSPIAILGLRSVIEELSSS